VTGRKRRDGMLCIRRKYPFYREAGEEVRGREASLTVYSREGKVGMLLQMVFN